jgi:hypothetical protein
VKDANGNEQMVDCKGNTLGVGDLVMVVLGDEIGTQCVVRAIAEPKLVNPFDGTPNTFQSGPRKGQMKPDAPFSAWRCRIDDGVGKPDSAGAYIGECSWKFSMWAGAEDVALVRKAGG